MGECGWLPKRCGRAVDTGRVAFCTGRFWWLKLKATVEVKDWDELDRFSKTKKSPIGYGVRRV